jgi:hypothetical protein
VLGDLEELRRERGLSDMPVIFTELGYTQRAGSTIHPWAAEGFELMRGGGVAADEHPELVVYDRRPVDVAERALAVRALRRSLERFAPSLLGGVLYWKLSTVPEHREIEPFVLVIGGESADPLQRELSALAEHGGAVR